MAAVASRFTVRALSSRAKCSDLNFGALKEWFLPGRKSCVCPRHNPAPTQYTCCNPCAQPEQVDVDWSKRCRHVKNYCFRNHGEDCSCAACAACREEDFHCHRAQIQGHGQRCDCALCTEPHDYGCRCSKCRAGNSKMLMLVRGASGRPKECKCGTCIEDPQRRKSDAHAVQELEKKVLQLGERCYCCLYHPRDCECKACKECKADMAQDEVRDKIVAKRQRQLIEVLRKQEGQHGAGCECLQCVAMRQRVGMTMCYEHLEMCRCASQLGKACRWCKVCEECIRLKRTQTLPKAEDYW